MGARERGLTLPRRCSTSLGLESGVRASVRVMRTIGRLLSVLTAAALPVALVPAVSVAQPGGRADADNGITARQARQIEKAQEWAATKRARSVRWCRSGNDYRRQSGDRSGAYLLTAGQWQRLGGDQFAARPAKAPRFAQDYVAWKLQRQSGPQSLTCLTGQWMQSLYVHRPGTRLGDILLPGTHDAGTAPIDVKAPCDPHFIYGSADYLELAKQRDPCGVAKLSRTQSLNLGDQLRAGVRYLDLRVGVPKRLAVTGPPVPKLGNPAKVPLVLHHEVVAQRLTRGLGQVITFANNHPAEQLVLDFQHLTFPDNPAARRYYQQALVKLLQSWTPEAGQRSLCQLSYNDRVFDVPDAKVSRVRIGDAWRLGRNVVVIVEPGGLPDRSCFRDRTKTLVSLWANTEDPDFLVSFNRQVTQQRKQVLAARPRDCYDPPNSAPGGRSNEPGDWCGLFVNQLQLSAQAGTQAACLFSDTKPGICSLFGFARLSNDLWPDLVRRWRMQRDFPMNITITDFFEHSDPSLVDTMIELNWRLLDR